MAVIPGERIDYSQAEPRPTTGLARTIPINTGSEAVARGIEQLGQGFEHIARAQRATDFSTKKREYDEKTFAAHQLYMQTGDEDERQKIIGKWSQEAEQTLSTDDPFLRGELNKFKGEVLQRDGETFAKTELAIKTRNVKDQSELNIQRFKETGQVNEAATEIHKLASMNLMSPADAGKQISDLPYTTRIAQANKEVYDNPETAMEFLKVENFQGADTDILKSRVEIQSLAQQQINHLGTLFDNNINEQMNKIDQQPNLSDVQLRDAAADLDKQIDASNIGGKRKTQLHREVRSWVKDEGNMDFELIRSLEDRVERIKAYGVNDPELIPDIKRARLEGGLGSRKEGSGKEANRLIKAATGAKTNVSISATRGVQTDFASTVKRYPNGLELEHLLHKDILDALDAHPEWNDTQAMSFAASRAKVYENLSEKQSGTLIEMRQRGQRYLGWQELPKEAQKKDLESIRNLKIPTFMRGKTALSGDWTKADVQKAQEIIGNSKEITPEMTQKFSDYLSEQAEVHFKQIGLPRATTKEQRDALPSGSQYIDRNGNIATKK
jgi:hypothetical protein